MSQSVLILAQKSPRKRRAPYQLYIDSIMTPQLKEEAFFNIQKLRTIDDAPADIKIENQEMP